MRGSKLPVHLDVRRAVSGGAVTFVVGVLGLATVLSGCGPNIGTTSYEENQKHRLRIVEVLGASTNASGAFIEFRNDSEIAVDGRHFAVSFGYFDTPSPLLPLPLDGTAAALRGDDVGIIEPHELALLVDPSMPTSEVERVACEAPIRTEVEGLGSSDYVLASTLRLQEARHCLPVFTFADEYKNLAARLKSSYRLTIYHKGEFHERAHGSWASALPGVAYERVGLTSHAMKPSPIGATPGERNFYNSDPRSLADSSEPLPIQVFASSPWRIGDRILELGVFAEGDPANAETYAAEVNDLLAGELPDNPMVKPFGELVSSAQFSVQAAVYQLNDEGALAALQNASQSGAKVELVTDAEFYDDPSYQPGFDQLSEAGVEVSYDFTESGNNRSATMHDKFAVVDRRWTWSGSFNPVADKPHRIHADNAVLLYSPAISQLHEGEFDSFLDGTFGVSKRDSGRAGGRAQVDGADISVRFSPGLTHSQRKRRADALKATGDPLAACEAVVASTGKPAIQERYRSLDPCGGPLDLLLAEIARAKSSIYFVSFSLSLDEMVGLFLERQDAGVDLRGVVDPTVSTRPQVDAMVEAGADVRYTPNSDPACPSYISPQSECPSNPNKVWLHHKFVVIDYGTDHPVVITGSHNLSDVAETQNDDALIVIRDRAVAERYYRIFREAYDHPQTLGKNRQMEDLSPLAITAVRPSSDPSEVPIIEIANWGEQPLSLAGVELWNRQRSLRLSSGILAAGESLALIVGASDGHEGLSSASIVIPDDEATSPFLTPATPVVLRAADGRWLATYDPYTAADGRPDWLAVGEPGSWYRWQFDQGQLNALRVRLLGVNLSPDAEQPSWEPAGMYSDWVGEYDVNDTGLILMKSASALWSPSQN